MKYRSRSHYVELVMSISVVLVLFSLNSKNLSQMGISRQMSDEIKEANRSAEKSKQAVPEKKEHDDQIQDEQLRLEREQKLRSEIFNREATYSLCHWNWFLMSAR